jgi:hypothetical protein
VTREKGKNTAASIRARLLTLAQSKGDDYQRVLGRYAVERFLYRLGRSPYRDKFALKGATLFTLCTGHTQPMLSQVVEPLLDLASVEPGGAFLSDRGSCPGSADVSSDKMLFDSDDFHGPFSFITR